MFLTDKKKKFFFSEMSNLQLFGRGRSADELIWEGENIKIICHSIFDFIVFSSH